MFTQQQKFKKLKALVSVLTSGTGFFDTRHKLVSAYKDHKLGLTSVLHYEPALMIPVQGQKNVRLGDKTCSYGAGDFLATFAPMTLDCELVGVTEENPVMGISIALDRLRLSKIILKIDEVDRGSRNKEGLPSGIVNGNMSDPLLDSTIRLLEVLSDPVDSAVLADAALDEVYYRLINNTLDGRLKGMLRQHGQFQQIAKVIEFLHEHLDQNVSIDSIASNVNMSASSLHRRFKQLMHVSPLQYVKNIRLSKAQQLILDGKNISEAGFLVGYNSPAQFSREYKRLFGITPSATVASL